MCLILIQCQYLFPSQTQFLYLYRFQYLNLCQSHLFPNHLYPYLFQYLNLLYQFRYLLHHRCSAYLYRCRWHHQLYLLLQYQSTRYLPLWNLSLKSLSLLNQKIHSRLN